MPSTILASTACEQLEGDNETAPSLTNTFRQMLDGQVPNLLRLYLNPYVTQATYCLTQYAEESWPPNSEVERRQIFLSNSLEEALSGAIKLARYDANAGGRSPAGLVIDQNQSLNHFCATIVEGETLSFLPDLAVCGNERDAVCYLREHGNRISFVTDHLSNWVHHDYAVREWFEEAARKPIRPLLILSTDQQQLSRVRELQSAGTISPDILVFDESFTNFEVPFGAFAARTQLYQHWTRRGMATFHSTTYQPNTISSLHLINCLRRTDPELIERHGATLSRIEHDQAFRLEIFRKLYSPSLAKLIATVGFDQATLKVSGNYLEEAGRRTFDGVAGVACSVRGHNPPTYLEDVQPLDNHEKNVEETSARLEALSGLPHHVPAVSGASAVEQALKIALTCQFPRDYVLAMKGGFGGKTLFALTGTWKNKLKQGLFPLYEKVVFVDPFAEDAAEAIESAFDQHPIGVVQTELVQGVGGVRPIPQPVLEQLAAQRQQHNCLLFVDEVQTGMFRTGPFVRSTDICLNPDLVTIGKAVSDMMFPFGMTLFSEAVRERLQSRGSDLLETLRSRYEYDFGYRTMLSTLRRAEQNNLEQVVRERGQQFSDLLADQLQSSRYVKNVRNFGLLLGIELDAGRRTFSWLSRLLPRLYLLGLLKHKTFPLLMGFCQYEPHVLKLTPPLSVTEQEVAQICSTIGAVLRQSPTRLALDHLSRHFALKF